MRMTNITTRLTICTHPYAWYTTTHHSVKKQGGGKGIQTAKKKWGQKNPDKHQTPLKKKPRQLTSVGRPRRAHTRIKGQLSYSRSASFSAKARG